MKDLFSPLTFPSGAVMKNRFMLSPLTNTQSHEDGRLSQEEFHWLTLRAKGGFGLVMSCASHVSAAGKGFPGQLGIFGDEHFEGHQRLAAAIREGDALAFAQLHHAGHRAPAALIGGAPLAPSAHEKSGAQAMAADEIRRARDDFIAAACRAQKAGYDGVEVHGAHNYLVCQFLSPRDNRREDEYGGSLENRARFLREVLAGIRAACGKNFILGLRLSPERFGLDSDEMLQLTQEILSAGAIDFLDLSLWDFSKNIDSGAKQGQGLLETYAALARGNVLLCGAGGIMTPPQAKAALAAGMDFVILGRAGILHHNYPALLAADPGFMPVGLPVAAAHLRAEGVSEKFIHYLSSFPGFVAQ